MEEKKQREALDSSRMSYEEKVEGIEKEDYNDYDGEKTDKERDEVEEETERDYNVDENVTTQENNEYNVSMLI